MRTGGIETTALGEDKTISKKLHGLLPYLQQFAGCAMPLSSRILFYADSGHYLGNNRGNCKLKLALRESPKQKYHSRCT